ncbi:MAG: tetratricopeptide repeat protein, partial [bacterium]|nr:tetratricopeptide repeat protein [bacterium]
RVRQVRDLLAQAKAQQSAGDYGVGLEIAHRAAAEAENIGYWPLIAEALLRRSSLEGSRARPEEVVATLHRSLEAAVAGGHERAAAETLTLLVWWVGYRQARFEQGLHYAELATAVLERLSESAQLQWKLVDYSGIIFFHQGNYEQALAHHRRALELKDQALGPDSIDAVYTLIRLGNVLITQGKPGAALAYYDRAFHITEGALGPTHPSVATALEHRGHAHRQLAQYQLARQCHERALMITEQVFGRHRRAAWILMELGTLDYLEGRFDRALERQREALKILEGTLGSENPQLA